MATKPRQQRAKTSASTQSAPPDNPLISNAKLKQLYAAMLQSQILDEQIQKVLGHSKPSVWSCGDATAVAATIDLGREDLIAPAPHRAISHLLKGMPLHAILSQLRPKTTDSSVATTVNPANEPSAFGIIPSAPNPAAVLNLASGVALTLSASKSGRVVVAFCDSSRHSGHRWSEALAFAGKHCLPLIVIVQNKAPIKDASKAKPFDSLLTEGHICEFPVIPVDAHDVVAIYRVASESIHKARHGGGPTLIEAVSARDADAIQKLEAHLTARGIFSASARDQAIEEFRKNLASALKTQSAKPRRRKASKP